MENSIKQQFVQIHVGKNATLVSRFSWSGPREFTLLSPGFAPEYRGTTFQSVNHAAYRISINREDTRLQKWPINRHILKVAKAQTRPKEKEARHAVPIQLRQFRYGHSQCGRAD
jgi:hypothetical protein